MVAVMAVISSSTKKLFYETSPRYFNSEHTIAFLSRLLQLHRKKKLCIFCDNASIHVGKKTTAFINSQPRLVLVKNAAWNPEANGIETFFHVCK